MKEPIDNKELIFSYDLERFDRRFMNCFQRQSMVFLERAGVPVDLLFADAYLSTDELFKQIVCDMKFKYALEGSFFSTSRLSRLGVNYHEHEADQFEEILPFMRSILSNTEDSQLAFAVLPGDVFYLPHCPEFKSIHLQHVVTVIGNHEKSRKENTWEIVDDNEASVLCHYKYDDAYLRDFYENCAYRKLMSFNVDQLLVADESVSLFREIFADNINNHEDTYVLFDRISDVLDNELCSSALKLRTCYDSMCLLSGSRSGLAYFLEAVGADRELVETVRSFADKAFVIQNMITKAQLTGRINVRGVYDRCQRLKSLDREIHGELKRLVEVRRQGDMSTSSQYALME